jgi:hypothetical protein
MEAAMTGILDKFYVEHDGHGARVMARSHQLTGGCLADDEIDTAVLMLKEDLDACAQQMKRLLKVNTTGALFEGWPSASELNPCGGGGDKTVSVDAHTAQSVGSLSSR